MSFQSDLVAAADAERQRVNGRKETDKDLATVLMDYWMTGTGLKEEKARKCLKDRVAWSAAFISFVVKDALTKSGSGAAFAFSGSHSVYAGAAIRNALAKTKSPAFWGLPPIGPGAVRPEAGDLVGVTRVKGIADFADALDAAQKKEPYFSHFDVVTNISNGVLSKIGGNVSDSVTLTKVKLKDGFLPDLPFKFDNAGQVISGPFICIVRLMS